MKWDKEIKRKLRSIIVGKIREIHEQVRHFPERDRRMAFVDAWDHFCKSHGIVRVRRDSESYCGYSANENENFAKQFIELRRAEGFCIPTLPKQYRYMSDILEEMVYQDRRKGKTIIIRDPEINQKGRCLSIPKDLAAKMLVLGHLP